jgi:flavin reductase (DIM6/NTAB) family NADH-FMN oxidoreductase RutF/rubredoxin
MDNKAFYKLSYGVFMLSTKLGDKVNGCMTNTCIQVANSPTRLSVAVLNSNYTCELMKESGIFNVSVLDKRCNFDIIKHFGYQSGRDVDKFKDIICPRDDRGVPYLQWGACSMFACKITEMIDLGSHTLFIGEVIDAKVLSDEQQITYDDYQKDIKPKPEKKVESKKIIGWKCKICGYIYKGSELPEDFDCPLCGHGPEDFEPIYE